MSSNERHTILQEESSTHPDSNAPVQQPISEVSHVDVKGVSNLLLVITEELSACAGMEYFTCLCEALVTHVKVHKALIHEVTRDRLHVLAQSTDISSEEEEPILPRSLLSSSGSRLSSLPYSLRVPLLRVTKEPIGYIEILSSKTFERPNRLQQLLTLLAGRASAELERFQWSRNTLIETQPAPPQQEISSETLSQMDVYGFLQNSKDLIYSVSLEDGSFVFINKAWQELLGYPQEELQSKTFFELLSENSLTRNQLLFQEFRQGLCVRSDNVELCIVAKDGTEIPIEGGLHCRWKDNVPVTLRGIFRDIRKYKRHEKNLQHKNEQLVRATRHKDEFLASMSHELRTPLNAILGMSEILRDQVFGELNPKQTKAITTIEKSGRHLLEVINDILDLAKIEANELELEYSRTSVPQLFLAAKTFVTKMATDKQLNIHTEYFDAVETEEIQLDVRRIQQVLLNLLTNAIKFTPEEGHITLSAGLKPISSNEELDVPSTSTALSADFYISVVDTGIGIDPKHLQYIFAPFLQIDSKLNRQYQGTGLGLTLVKRLVELHGGTIQVESKKEQGTCVDITLPLRPHSSTLSRPPQTYRTPIPHVHENGEQTQPETSDKPVVLLAEDDEDNTYCVTSYLQRRGYHVLRARDGREALQIAQQSNPDIILMDIHMPRMNGFEAMGELRRRPQYKRTPIIAVTAMAMSGDRDRCLKAGANDCFAKPFRLKHLERRIQEFLQNPLPKR